MIDRLSFLFNETQSILIEYVINLAHKMIVILSLFAFEFNDFGI